MFLILTIFYALQVWKLSSDFITNEYLSNRAHEKKDVKRRVDCRLRSCLKKKGRREILDIVEKKDVKHRG